MDKPTAWACTLTNLVTLPGLGTVAGGRGVGYVQAGVALVGFGLSLLGVAGALRDWLHDGELPHTLTRSLEAGLVGISLYLTAWLWALGSSLGFHRQARQPPPLDPRA